MQTIKIAHRVNVLSSESASDIFSKCDGIEFDIRDSDGDIIVQHDAFKSGQLFSEFLEYCPSNKFYIVNVKAEGVEERAIEMLEAAGIQNFFLLDCGIPAIMKLKKQGERRIAIRFSEVEPLEMVTALQGCATWVWIDCFQKFPLTAEIAELFHKMDLKICLVSPDLQGRPEDIEAYVIDLRKKNIQFDAICAKLWNHSKWTFTP